MLVRHREGGKWVAPGGGIEPYERPADAAVREIWEETGLLVEPVRVLGVYGGPEFHWEYSNGDKVGYVMIVFEGNVTGEKKRSWRWVILQRGSGSSCPAPNS